MNEQRLAKLLLRIERAQASAEAAIRTIRRSRLPQGEALADDLLDQCIGPANPFSVAEDHVGAVTPGAPDRSPDATS